MPGTLCQVGAPALVTGSSGLVLRVFGGLSAQREGRDVDLGGPRQRAVLALLLVARGAPVAPDRLADQVWESSPPASATAVLQSYISHLRRALEPHRAARDRGGVLVRAHAGYSCRLDPDAVDAWRFERLVAAGTAAAPPDAVATLSEAVGLHRGQAYAEWAGQGWADAERARLEELHAVATEHLLAGRLATGDAAVLVPQLEALTSEDPLREERWRLLALALYRSHRQSDALAALRRARRVLDDELGVEPSAALRALEAQILTQSPALDLPRAPVPPTTPAGAPTAAVPSLGAPPAPPAADDIVERDGELRQLRRCLDDAVANNGLAVLIQGPAGIGKSRLLAEARRMAGERDVAVLTARGSTLEAEFGFGAVRQLFEPLLADPAARGPALAGAAAPAAAVFSSEPGGEQRVEGAFALMHALYWLVVNLTATRPLVLAVDDLQWWDASSLRFLAYLVHRLEGLPVLVVATLRTGEQPVEAALVAEVTHDPATVSLQPGPLTRDGVADLVRRRLGADPTPPFVTACHRTTGGNPLLLRQVLRALEADGVHPDTAHAGAVAAIGSRAVSGIVLLRLSRLPAPAAAVARAVAVLGDGAALPAVAALAGVDEKGAAAAASALAGAEILGEAHPLAFVHPLVRDAVYRSLAAGERELAHERAARVLVDGGGSAEQVAAHLLQVPARGQRWVVESLRRAATTAAERGAPESAISYLLRVLDEPPEDAERAGVLLQLGALEALLDGDAAIGHLRAAHALAPDVPTRAEAAVALAVTLIFAGPPGEVVGFARRAAAELPPELVDVHQALVAIARIGGWMHGVEPGVVRDRPLEPVVGTGLGARMLATATAWEMLLDNHDLPRCEELARFGLADGVLQDSDPGLYWVVAAFVLDVAGHDMEEFWDGALTGAYERGSLFAALATHLWRGHAQWWRGDLREAEQSLVAAIAASEKWAAPALGVSYGDAFLVGVLLDRGQVERARAFVDAHRWRHRIGDGERLNAEAEVALLLAEGRPREALAVLAAPRTFTAGVVNPVWAPWRSLQAQALGALGRREEAVALLEEELALTRAYGARRWIGRVLSHLGQAEGEAGEAHLREAIDVLTTTAGHLDRARAQAALADLVGEPEATRLRTAALEGAERCGADALRDSLATSLGTRAGTLPGQRPAALRLTRTERRVATMAADGMAARQIAASLYLTPRTVEVTLDAVRTALGVNDDAELRGLLTT